ncbi:MAG TPA: ABC transporter ATP-binding protein [Candidatus Acidoferrum sp.]|nr:ABC transporter ATP-binding protein [Candidatus Acidoferrum sp.]
MHHIFRLVRLIPGYHKRFFAVLAVNTVLGLGAVVTPYLFKVIVDNIVSLTGKHADINAARDGVLASLAILAAIRFVTVILGYVQDRASGILFFETMWGLRRQLFRHMVYLSIDYYEQHRVGEIIQRISNATAELRGLLAQWAQGALLNVLTLIFIVAILLVRLPPVGILMLVMVPAMLGSAMYRIRKSQPVQREWVKLSEKTLGTISETVSLIATIRSFGQEANRIRQYEQETDDFRKARFKHFYIEWRLSLVQDSVIAITSLAALAIVALGALHGTYTAGDILLVLTYLTTVVGSINPIVRLIINTGEVEISAERAVELLEVEPTVVDRPDATELKKLESIEFRGVSFQYPGKDRKVLDSVSFTLQAGQTLALVGPSGVGKTTITKLLLRFYEPTAGLVLINGQDVHAFTQASVRNVVGMVMQDVALFNDTVEANVRFARPEATQSELVSAAKTAHADMFIDALPDGYMTLVGERGIKLSGGEKQRIAIARAVLRNPQLAILDEATSALDSESESYVQDGLKQLLKGRTAIIIAHRLSTVRQADQIVVLQDGKVLESGTHAELTDQKGGLYAKLFKLQTDGVLKD